MTLNVSLLSEPLDQLHKVTNLALHMAWEAQQRGYNVFYHNLETMRYCHGKVYAECAPLTLEEGFENFTLGEFHETCLNDMDVALFMIEKMPFNMPFLSATHLMQAVQKDALVVNDPVQIRNAANKLILMDLPDVIPPMIITSSYEQIKEFLHVHEEIVVKPLYGMHSDGVFFIHKDSKNLRTTLSILNRSYEGPWMIQKYIPEVEKGDKRLYLVNGEFVGGLNRIPAPGEYQVTTYTGGMTEKPEITERDLEICRYVGDEMKKRGILFAGLDIIGSYLTEVNTGCPGGLGYVNKYFDTNVQKIGWDVIEEKLGSNVKNLESYKKACAL